jgi:hypothetical protein
MADLPKLPRQHLSRASPGSCRFQTCMYNLMGSTIPLHPSLTQSKLGPEVFHAGSETDTFASAIDYNLRLHPRDRECRSAPTSHNCQTSRFAVGLPSAINPAETGLWPAQARLLRFLRPSGDITAGVRSTRAFHTRHLPPMPFLRTSTDYSSRRLACPVSYRHHLWDSKNTCSNRLPCGPDRTILGTALFGITKTRTCQQPEDYQPRKSCRNPTTASHYLLMNLSGQTLRRRVTHRTARKQTEREEGTSTCPSF